MFNKKIILSFTSCIFLITSCSFSNIFSFINNNESIDNNIDNSFLLTNQEIVNELNTYNFNFLGKRSMSGNELVNTLNSNNIYLYEFKSLKDECYVSYVKEKIENEIDLLVESFPSKISKYNCNNPINGFTTYNLIKNNRTNEIIYCKYDNDSNITSSIIFNS